MVSRCNHKSYPCARKVGSHILLLHATGAFAAEIYRMALPELTHKFLLRQHQRNARESLLKILSEIRKSNNCFVFETIEFPFDLTVELIEDFDLSICLDSNYMYSWFFWTDRYIRSPWSIPTIFRWGSFEWCPSQGPGCSIEYGKDHQSLSHGDHDIGRFLDRIELSGFNSPVVLEPELHKALVSLDYFRSIHPGLFTSQNLNWFEIHVVLL